LRVGGGGQREQARERTRQPQNAASDHAPSLQMNRLPDRPSGWSGGARAEAIARFDKNPRPSEKKPSAEDGRLQMVGSLPFGSQGAGRSTWLASDTGVGPDTTRDDRGIQPRRRGGARPWLVPPRAAPPVRPRRIDPLPRTRPPAHLGLKGR